MKRSASSLALALLPEDVERIGAHAATVAW